MRRNRFSPSLASPRALLLASFLLVAAPGWIAGCAKGRGQAPVDQAPAKDPYLADYTPVDETLEVRTVPSGATVKLSTGETCKSPCRLPKKSTDTFDVRIEKQGYRPQQVTVVSHARVVPGSGANGVPEIERPKLTPNPVQVTLEPAWSKR